MDIQPQTTQPISDDQELAKVLAGIDEQADAAAALDKTVEEELKKQEETVPVPDNLPFVDVETPLPTMQAAPVASGTDSDLAEVKKVAIDELKPLVDKLTLPAEEKFDLYLLLIRSTDDSTLIAPAHEVAKTISDDTRRAQALLDIIKEIDYLSPEKEDTPKEDLGI